MQYTQDQKQIFGDAPFQNALVPIEFFYTYVKAHNITGFLLKLYVDYDSDYLLTLHSYHKIDATIEAFYNILQNVAQKHNIELSVFSPFYEPSSIQSTFSHYASIINQSISRLSIPLYIIAILVLLLNFSESLAFIRSEVRLFLIRGSKKRKIVIHFLSIFSVIDFLFLLILAGISEAITHLVWQDIHISSFFWVFKFGFAMFCLIEIIKLLGLVYFVNKEILKLKGTEKSKIQIKRQNNTHRALLVLLLTVIIFVYRIVLTLIAPAKIFEGIGNILDLIAIILLFLAFGVLISDFSLKFAFSVLHRFTHSIYGVLRLLQNLILVKKRQIQLLAITSFWLVCFSTIIINSNNVELMLSYRDYFATHLDISITFTTEQTAFPSFDDNISLILNDPDVEAYIIQYYVPVVKADSVSPINAYGYLYFLSLNDLLKANPQYICLRNNEGQALNISAVLTNPYNVLVNRKVKEEFQKSNGENITITADFSSLIDYLHVSDSSEKSFNVTIIDDFYFLPTLYYRPWEADVSNTDYFYYIADVSLMRQLWNVTVFKSVYIKLKPNTDADNWYESIKSSLVDKQFRVNIPKSTIYNNEASDSDWLTAHVYSWQMIVICLFVMLYFGFFFNEIISSQKRVLSTGISRGINRKNLRKSYTVVLATFFATVFLFSFIMGIFMSIMFFGHSKQYICELLFFKVPLISNLALFLMGAILLSAITIVLISSFYAIRNVDVSSLTQMGESVIRGDRE